VEGRRSVISVWMEGDREGRRRVLISGRMEGGRGHIPLPPSTRISFVWREGGYRLG